LTFSAAIADACDVDQLVSAIATPTTAAATTVVPVASSALSAFRTRGRDQFGVRIGVSLLHPSGTGRRCARGC
jgi:hypothetical protein